ncbi:hypothetical protein SLS62_004280 [Diatrype stigma]|uniref:BZIP domain-containing protein n=1 Tax=Diatrype stigma TaxID=117547 RepID=A0AAN9UTE1_9PEZI
MAESIGADFPDFVKQQQQRKKRVVTAARREQNKIAQRTYRERQRLKKQTSQCNDVRRTPRRLKPRCHSEGLLEKAAPPRGLTSDEPSASLAPGTGVVVGPPVINQADPILPCLTPPSYLGDDYSSFTISPAGNPSQPYETDPDAVEEPQVTAFPAYDATLDVVQPRPATGAVDLHANTLEDTQTTVYLACLRNAHCLGLDPSELAACPANGRTCTSPFFRPATASASTTTTTTTTAAAATLLVSSSARRGLPPHLQPTLAQILIPHHVSLDLIPLPAFRDRAILMAAALPQLFDPWDLKLDIYVRGALVCWRSRRGAACQPWDVRSWEAKPWFLRKWTVVINSGSGDGPGGLGGLGGLGELVPTTGGSQAATVLS